MYIGRQPHVYIYAHMYGSAIEVERGIFRGTYRAIGIRTYLLLQTCSILVNRITHNTSKVVVSIRLLAQLLAVVERMCTLQMVYGGTEHHLEYTDSRWQFHEDGNYTILFGAQARFLIFHKEDSIVLSNTLRYRVSPNCSHFTTHSQQELVDLIKGLFRLENPKLIAENITNGGSADMTTKNLCTFDVC